MKAWLALMVGLVVACDRHTLQPVPIDPANDACAHCRMLVSDRRTAAEIVAPGEEPRIFDDLGCLRDALTAMALPADAVIYVADHRTGSWVDARTAHYVQTTASTPMTSGILAHADRGSRDADAVAASGRPLDVAEVLGPNTARGEAKR
jgi:copper chaperone NosL